MTNDVWVNDTLLFTSKSRTEFQESDSVHDNAGCMYQELEEFRCSHIGSAILMHRMWMFTRWHQSAKEKAPGVKMILCNGDQDKNPLDQTILLLGAYLILSEHQTAKDAGRMFPA